MKNQSGKFRSFLALAVSFLVVVSPIYLQYDNLSEVDFFSPTPAFEILDPEETLADEKNQITLTTPSFSGKFFIICSSRGAQLPPLIFPDFSLNPFTSSLRC